MISPHYKLYYKEEYFNKTDLWFPHSIYRYLINERSWIKARIGFGWNEIQSKAETHISCNLPGLRRLCCMREYGWAVFGLWLVVASILAA